MILSCVAAVSENFVIGVGGRLPWHLPADMRHFQRLTKGHTIIMGRHTWESIGGPLSERTSIVLSRKKGFYAKGALVAPSLEDALHSVCSEDEVFVVGGQSVYEQALPQAERLYLTVVQTKVDGDAFFPARLLAGWKLLGQDDHEADEENPYAYTFRLYERA